MSCPWHTIESKRQQWLKLWFSEGKNWHKKSENVGAISGFSLTMEMTLSKSISLFLKPGLQQDIILRITEMLLSKLFINVTEKLSIAGIFTFVLPVLILTSQAQDL